LDIFTILITIPILLLVWSVIGVAFYKYMRTIGTVMVVIAVVGVLYVTVLSRGESGVGTQNFSEHSELHELIIANNMPYVAMKGLASAMYYPDPSLRSMDDVDFLVEKENVSRAGKLFESIGFAVDHGEEDDGIHIAYTRPPMSIWELHHSVNGIPNNDVVELIQAEMDKTIPTAETAEVDGSTCRLPDKLHHGLIMLLRTASHLTSEGVGLSHLCDWVVFASALSDAEFREIFEKKLKRFGLWRFAQVLTLLGILRQGFKTMNAKVHADY
jgi:hypothetical protein